MKKKILLMIAVCFGFGLVFVAQPLSVSAAAPCSIDTINAANAQIAQAQLQYAQAQAAEAAALQQLNQVRAGGNELAIATAAFSYNQAVNQAHWYLDQVNNAKAFLANISARADAETRIEQTIAQLSNLTDMQQAKQDADNAQAIATGVKQQIAMVQAAIAAYTQQLGTSPSVQAQIDQLNVQLRSLQADYAKQQSIADQKLVLYNAAVAKDQYAGYQKSVIDDSADRLFRRGEYHPYKAAD